MNEFPRKGIHSNPGILVLLKIYRVYTVECVLW